MNTAIFRFAETPVGEIAARLPGATAVFRSLKLDYCCGGAQTLASAAERRGLDLGEVERQLVALNQKPTTVSDDPGELIDFILSRYHETHRRELAELLRLASRVEKVHADHPEAPIGLTDFLSALSDELEGHMQKEEAMLFPMMRAAHPMVSAPISVMESEHEGHAEALIELERIAHNMEPPAGACGSWRALYAGLRKLADDLRDHIHTENNILFPQFARR